MKKSIKPEDLVCDKPLTLILYTDKLATQANNVRRAAYISGIQNKWSFEEGIEMAKLMVQTINASKGKGHVLIVTNSPSFVMELNILILLDRVGHEARKVYGYDESLVLDYRQVDCYQVTRKSMLMPVPVTEYGIAENILSHKIIEMTTKHRDIKCIAEL